MLPVALKDEIESLLSEKASEDVRIDKIQGLSGGSINRAFLIHTSAAKYFLKYNRASAYPAMFETEARGLEVLHEADEIRVPLVIATGETGEDAFLLLEYIDAATERHDFWESFGRRLASLHKHTTEMFGLDYDNYIGSLRQYNKRQTSWLDFFREERLLIQMEMARKAGLLSKQTEKAFEKLFQHLEDIFPSETPSLIHGDLWSGNYMVDEKGEACIMDPAVYYGFREMDIGMSRLFGGFSGRFYDSYNEAFPMAPGWEDRIEICNLYPLMVHVNLFGGGYIGSVESILRRFN